MKEVYFHNNGRDEDVGNFLISLGEHQHAVLEDLFIIANAGPDALDCGDHGGHLRELRRLIAPGRYVVLLFIYLKEIDAYIVLHGFRAGREGATRADIRHARRVQKAYE